MTEENNTTQNIFAGINIPNIPDFAEGYKNLPRAAQSLLQIHSDNLATMKKIQTLAIENFQKVSNRQTEIFSQIMAQTSEMANDLVKEGKPEDKLSRNIEAIQKSVETAMANAKEISLMVKKANEDAAKILKKGNEQSYKNIQETVKSVASSAQ